MRNKLAPSLQTVCGLTNSRRDLPIIGHLPGKDANLELNTTINRPNKDFPRKATCGDQFLSPEALCTYIHSNPLIEEETYAGYCAPD